MRQCAGTTKKGVRCRITVPPIRNHRLHGPQRHRRALLRELLAHDLRIPAVLVERPLHEALWVVQRPAPTPVPLLPTRNVIANFEDTTLALAGSAPEGSRRGVGLRPWELR
jgi:hypothetical protein